MLLTQTKKELIEILVRRYIKPASFNVAATAKSRRLLMNGAVQLRSIDYQNSKAEFSVNSQSIAGRVYGVTLSGFDSIDMRSSCSCPYDGKDFCKHEIAAINYFLQNLNAPEVFEINAPKKIKPVNVITESALNEQPEGFYLVQLPSLDPHAILKYISWDEYGIARNLNLSNMVTEDFTGDDRASYKVIHKQMEFLVTLENKGNQMVLLYCNCFDTAQKICIHKAAALYNLQARYGNHGLKFLKNRDSEKENLLKDYGYSLKDNIENKFEFYFDDSGLKIKILDASIQKIPGTDAFNSWSKKFFGLEESFEEKAKRLGKINDAQELIFVFSKGEDGNFPDTIFNVFKGKRKKDGELSRTVELLSLNQLHNIKGKSAIETSIIKDAIAISPENLLASHIKSSWYENSIKYSSLNEDDFIKLQQKMNNGLEELFNHAIACVFFTGYKVSRYQPVTPDVSASYKLSADRLKVIWELSEDDEHFILKPLFDLNGEAKSGAHFEKFSKWLWIKNATIYKLATVDDLLLLEKINNQHEIKFRTKDFETIFNTMIKPLSKKNKVKIIKRNEKVIEGVKPVVNLYLKEYDKFLLLMPRYEYVTSDVKEEGEIFTQHDLLFTKNDEVYNIKRDLQAENEYTTFFKSLHPDFEANLHQEFFHIPFDKVMQGGWFFDLFDKLKEKEINVFWQNDLQKIKYNPNRPTLKVRSSSGIDWFDLTIQISFGDIDVPLSHLRKAIINKQFFIPLSDGTIGMLPEEWVARYAQILRIGKVDDDTLKVSKWHFSLIDDLIGEMDNEELMRELQEKKKKLLNFQNVKAVEIPKNVKATLRHYQEDGFQWLNFLDEFQWGGCLADDMGLGKTLQVLTFLQHLKNEKRLGTCLVVVPTTLIFNWNNEVQKYCKKLKVLTHRGVEREVNHDVFGKYDIVLTTYGTLRSDINDFKEFNFHYIILDESQAIKNPVSQISKAVRLLKAKNRLVMTGTPIENNTFDLYSQLEFLNPGFLGTQEFFKTEYATAIDKYADENRANDLRKMIAPFVLKRTKEEVAKDLPEKTETILYCEMGKAQRKLYDAFRKKYRDDIMNKIDSEGIGKSGFLILEGLLKLRMICDSTALVGDAENDYGNDSAKLEELIREISENAGHHKILVFSQFLKMLDLIKQKLEELKIPYQYLDGQTIDRKDRVDSFQNDDTVRVFLISLKAGGVGINLTEADYVYLVDPWWNPAVERQAIDRTHRIGQKKNVFAYKMICKDTIEEKIIQLQEKKKTLASNLIDTEKNILKKLNKEDIALLFG